jgi:hypothetical protein
LKTEAAETLTQSEEAWPPHGMYDEEIPMEHPWVDKPKKNVAKKPVKKDPTVEELKNMLSELNQDTSGKKNVLIERLASVRADIAQNVGVEATPDPHHEVANDGEPVANDGEPVANDGEPVADDGEPMDDGEPVANDGELGSDCEEYYEHRDWECVPYLYSGVLKDGTQMYNKNHEIVGRWKGGAVDFEGNELAIEEHNSNKY